MSGNGEDGPEKIVVLGGGMAAMAAAFELSDHPQWQEKYSITLYQIGWRLGGKGASGRNRGKHDRIEEHGLHVWLGFYHHAFRLLRQCYGENDRSPSQPMANWQDAFNACHSLAGIEYIGKQRLPWIVNFPEAPGLPGDDATPARPGLWQVLRKVLQFMAAFDRRGGGDFLGETEKTSGKGPMGRATLLKDSLASLKLKIQLGSVAMLEILFVVLAFLSGKSGSRSAISKRSVAWLLDRCLRDARQKVEGRLETDTHARRFWIMIDFFVATVKGLHAEGITGFDGMVSLDRYDFREFLAKYGASETTLKSPVICGFYNLGFAYLQGQKSKPSLAAGVILRFSLLMFFNYRGAMFWKMRAGMGDVVFAPLYQVLEKRGVRFEFFHKVKNLELTPDGQSIGAIALGKQATLKVNTGKKYQPLVEVKGLPCWPNQPLFEQLVDGEAMEAAGIDLESDWQSWPETGELRLEKGLDFDTVILGIGLGALPKICGELLLANPKFETMVKGIPTVQTCALQLWLRPSLAEMGWNPEVSLFDGEGESMSTWCDMSHLIPAESWSNEVGHLAYFCSVMSDPEVEPLDDDLDFPEREAQKGRRQGLALLDDLGHFWPNAVRDDGSKALNLGQLVGGDQPLEDQFFKANSNRSDRYVLAAKGTTQFRLKADESGFQNLILAGDWTENGLNYGCIEAATMSGLQAARAILSRMEKQKE